MALQLFAASLLEVCPKTILIQMSVGRTSFTCDFVLPFTLTEDHIRLIEERVRAKIKEGVQADIWEMVSSNAKELLIHSGQTIRAQQIDLESQFANVIRMHPFANFYEGEIETDLSTVGLFSLKFNGAVGRYSEKKIDADIQRVEGFAFPDKKAFNEFKRLRKDYRRVDHRQHKLFEDGFATPRAMRLLNGLEKHWRGKLEGFEEVQTPECSGYERFCQMGSKQFLEIWEDPIESPEFDLREGGGRVGIVIDYRQEERETFLQWIEDFCKLFGLQGNLSDSKDFLVLDKLGLEWQVARIEDCGNFSQMKFYFHPFLALIIEQRGIQIVEKML